jgi:hypothetical protein
MRVEGKPEWAQRVSFHRQMEHFAIAGAEQAEKLRCTAGESGGERCTADAYPAHEHRYNVAELPGVGE